MTSSAWKQQAYPLQQVTIRLEGTRHSERDNVIQQLEAVIARLRKGEVAGCEHDDDFGYDFVVNSSVDGPSFFDEPAGSR